MEDGGRVSVGAAVRSSLAGARCDAPDSREFAAAYLRREGLSLGEEPMPVPDGLEGRAGPDLMAVLAELDSCRVDGETLSHMVNAYQRLIAHQQAGLLQTLWEWARTPSFDGGTAVRAAVENQYAAEELAPLTTWTSHRAASMLGLARLAVDTAPALLAAMDDGRLDLDKLNVISAELATITDEALIRHIVGLILDDVHTHTTGTLRARIRKVIGDIDPDAVRKQRQRAIDERSVIRNEVSGGLMSLVCGFYDAAAATAAYNYINAIATATRTCGDMLGRSMDQLRADVAIDLLRGVDPARAGFATPADRKGTINLTVGLSTLAGFDDQCGEIAGYGPIAADIARQTAAQLADVCQWRFNVHDQDGDLAAEGCLPRATVTELAAYLRAWAVSGDLWYGPGALSTATFGDGRPDAAISGMRRHPVDASAGPDGRAHRDPSAAQVAFVRARDKTCQFPGCRVPAHRCDVEHRIAWVDGGMTVVANLYLACRRHHRAKHEAGFGYQPCLGGILWTTPRGTRYVKQHHPPGGTRPGHHRHPEHVGPVTIDLVGYAHAGGPRPRLRH